MRNGLLSGSPDDNLCTKPSDRFSVETERGRVYRSGHRRFQIAAAHLLRLQHSLSYTSDIAAAAAYYAGKKFPVPFR